MPFGLKSIWIQLVTMLAIIVWFILRFSGRHAAGVYDGPEGLVALGVTVLWFAAGVVVFMIAAHILGLILIAIAEGGKEPDTMTDERDRMIEAEGDRVSNAVSGLGFLAGIVALTLGYSVPVVIATMFVGCLAGAVVGNVVKLRAYAVG